MDDLTTAAQDGDVGRLRQLLEVRKGAHHGAGEEQISSDSLQKACHIAARNNHSAALEILLNEGTEIERATISAAAYSGSIDVFRLLIARGWDVNEPLGHPGDALLYENPLYSNMQLNWITDARTSNSMAIGADNVELANFLISKGADPNANLRGESYTPLECAALSGSTSLVKTLVNAGAQIKGRYALQLAAYEGKTEVISYLLDCGAPIDEAPNIGLGISSALGEAASKGHVEALKLLLEKGANVDVKDMSGKNALELAEMNKHDVCVDILREAREEHAGEGKKEESNRVGIDNEIELR